MKGKIFFIFILILLFSFLIFFENVNAKILTIRVVPSGTSYAGVTPSNESGGYSWAPTNAPYWSKLFGSADFAGIFAVNTTPYFFFRFVEDNETILNCNDKPQYGNRFCKLSMNVDWDITAYFCQDYLCTLGTTQCSGSQIQTCITDINGCPKWSSPTNCPQSGQTCQGGECAGTSIPSCAHIGEDEYCCNSQTQDYVCPEDFEDENGNTITCSPPDYDCIEHVTPCQIGDIQITPQCGGDECDPGDSIKIDISYSGECPSTAYVQVDANNSDECILSQKDFTIRGMNVTCDSQSCSKQWTIPSIPQECLSETVYSWAVGLYDEQFPTSPPDQTWFDNHWVAGITSNNVPQDLGVLHSLL